MFASMWLTFAASYLGLGEAANNRRLAWGVNDSISPASVPATTTADFRGFISTGAVDHFIVFLRENPQISTVFIDSIGGEEDSSIRLAQILNERDIRLVGNRNCSSACLQVLLLSNRQPVIVRGTRTIVHQSSYGIIHGYDFNSAEYFVHVTNAVSTTRDLSDRIDRLFIRRPDAKSALIDWTIRASLLCLREVGPRGRPVLRFVNRGYFLTEAEGSALGITYVDDREEIASTRVAPSAGVVSTNLASRNISTHAARRIPLC